jgi:uncharacterized protein (TIGR03083 family)
MSAELDHLHHLDAESARFRSVLNRAQPSAPVPTCPGWDAADLLWHLTEVQAFWSAIVRERCADPGELPGPVPSRPDSYADLLELAETTAAELSRVLAATPASTGVWTWSDDRTAGFVRRRQAHEALIHRVDAECVTGQRTPLDAALAADGVDEALRVMFGESPDWVQLDVDEHASIRVTSTDTGKHWLVRLARYQGTDEAGQEQAGSTVVVADQDHDLATAATVSATAADLDCWLWSRPPQGAVELAGDVQVLAGLRAVVAEGIQ